MPRKTKDEQLPLPEFVPGRFFCAASAEWGGFINLKMSDELTDVFKLWVEEYGNKAQETLTEFLAEGGKLSLVWDGENQCFIGTYTGALVENSASRFAMSARAGGMMECLALLAWKHLTVLSNGGYGEFRPRAGGFGSWG